uniref:Ig-like domain-containing protein n=1 Tax=Salmo trutta TaxID=8032 RepID=A0A673W402_SALTR
LTLQPCSSLSVSGVTVVTQKPPVVTVRKGETATMDCNLGTVENSAARWYKQVPGGVPQYVLFRYNGDNRVFYGSDYRLIINNVEDADSAVYYCQTHDVRSANIWTLTKLLSFWLYGDLATPAVTLFPPSTEDLKSSRATLVCLASNLSQRSKGLADVSWMSNGESVTEDVSTSPAEQQPDKTFKISSYLTIQTAEWDKDVVFTCKVSLGSTFSEKEIRKTSCSL